MFVEVYERLDHAHEIDDQIILTKNISQNMCISSFIAFWSLYLF